MKENLIINIIIIFSLILIVCINILYYTSVKKVYPIEYTYNNEKAGCCSCCPDLEEGQYCIATCCECK